MRGSSSILFLFRNEINKFNNTGARMLDSTYYMNKCKTSSFCHYMYVRNVLMDVITFTENL